MAQHPQWKPFSLTHITYPTSQPIAPLLALLSLTPPFGVCALTTATVIYKDVLAAYLLVGSVSSTIVTSILKKLIREPRPPRYDDAHGDGDGDDDDEFGMPSNHSCFAWFCTVFVILYVLRGGRVWAATALPSRTLTHQSTSTSKSSNRSVNGNGNDNGNGNALSSISPLTRLWHHLHSTFVIVTSLIIAVGCAYSRVYLGYHTPMQVYVGSAIGSLLGMVWYALFETKQVRNLLVWLDGKLCELERASMTFEGSNNNATDGIGMKRD